MIFYNINYTKLVNTLIEQKHFDSVTRMLGCVDDHKYPLFYAIGTKDGNTKIKCGRSNETSGIESIRERKTDDFYTVNDFIRTMKRSCGCEDKYF